VRIHDLPGGHLTTIENPDLLASLIRAPPAPRRREPAVMTRPITRHTPPEEIMSSLRPLLERNRVFAATGAHAGLAMKQLSGQPIGQSGEGRRGRLHLEVPS
jgi:hypothetical protein